METITFNPFRIDKTGRIIVSSYMYWRKPLMLHRSGKQAIIKTTVDLDFNFKGFVYNSKGQKLYWPNFKSFDDIPERYIVGLDCEGTPAFAHVTEERISDDKTDFFKRYKYNMQPLTIDVVKRYFEEMVEITSETLIWENVRKKVV